MEQERQRNQVHKIKLEKSREESISYLFNNKEELEKSKKFLKDFDQFEQDKLNFAIKKNELESFIFKLKELTEDEKKKPYLQELEIEKFLSKSQEVDDYMFGDEIVNAELHTITAKINEINELIRPLSTRMDQHKKRDQFLEYTRNQFKQFIEEVKKIEKRKKWIPKEKLTEILNFINTEKEKQEELYKKQVEMALNLDPIFSSDFFIPVESQIDHMIKDLRRIPKPKNETETTNPEGTPSEGGFNMEDLKKFDPNLFDPSKMNLNPEQMEEMMKKMEDLKKHFEELQKKLPKNPQDENKD